MDKIAARFSQQAGRIGHVLDHNGTDDGIKRFRGKGQPIGADQVGEDGRDGTEIDIVEMPWRDGRITMNLHWDGYGKETWRTSAGGVSQVPEFIKLTEEIGPWAGDIRKVELPDYFVVDYVRVYDMSP
jgi:hypothetical protein